MEEHYARGCELYADKNYVEAIYEFKECLEHPMSVVMLCEIYNEHEDMIRIEIYADILTKLEDMLQVALITDNKNGHRHRQSDIYSNIGYLYYKLAIEGAELLHF